MLAKKEDEYEGIQHQQIEIQPLLPPPVVKLEDGDISEPVPVELQLIRWDNILIPACYLCVGVCQGLNRPLLNVYPLDLGATEAQQATISLVVMIPATLKIIFGFVSDNFPILGYRRKSYILIGWLAVTVIMTLLYQQSDLSMEYDTTGNALPPPNAPSVESLSLAFLAFGVGMWLADVMGDSIVVGCLKFYCALEGGKKKAEKARLEPEDRKGQLQSTCYASRFFGIMIAAPVSTYLYSACGPGSIVILLACAPLPIIPLLFLFYERQTYQIPSTKDHCIEIWNTVCCRAVWQPLGFLFLYNLLQVQNSAWRQYLRTVLGFTAQELNALLVVSYIFLFIGTVAYKYLFLHASWRRVYQFCILINGFLTMMQLLLIRQRTFGLSNFWFALGDDAAQEFISGVQFLPGSIMMVNLCPPGSEGASYALFTTAWNLAILLAPSISSTLLSIWDVSVEALASGYLDGLFNLSLLTAAIQTAPVFLLFMLPKTRGQLMDLASKPSILGGSIFLIIMFGSMSYVVIIGILNIVKPGWSGAS
eukprot:scaffold871_cov130-Cylindrotheca_fusiformis.AAC.15